MPLISIKRWPRPLIVSFCAPGLNGLGEDEIMPNKTVLNLALVELGQPTRLGIGNIESLSPLFFFFSFGNESTLDSNAPKIQGDSGS
jgi:hypothetical protein